MQALEPFYVHYPTKEEEEIIINLVEQILNWKQQNKETIELEQKIDLIVYKLYWLTYDEVLVVDPEFSMGREEYENFEIGT